MDIKKLALLATFAFVITGIVVYQVRATRNTAVAPAVAVGSSEAPAASAPEIPQTSLPAVSNVPEVKGEAPKPAVESQVLSIPDGWGRSPFLTVEEFNKLHEPVAPTPVIAPEAPPPPVPEALPQHEFSGSLSSEGKWSAFINGKIYRVGDKIGKEVVTQITEEAVTLEFEGKSRKLTKAKPRA